VTVPIALVAFALLVAILAPRLLGRGAWSRLSPRAGLVAWQASVFSVLGACVLLALTALLPVEQVSFDVGHLIHACPDVLRGQYSFRDGSWLRPASLLIATGTVLALLAALVLRGAAVRRGRTRQRQLLDLLMHQRNSRYGAHVLEHDVPLAYCVPGGGGRIVVTSAAIEALDDRQILAVLAHERAHLDERHDLILFCADVATTAFPWSRFFRRAHRELGTLVEMLADDVAAQRSDRASLASALVDLGQCPAPEGTVGADGDTVVRVERLVRAAPALSRPRRAAVLVASLALVATPWVIAVTPAWAAHYGLCLLPNS